MISSENSRGRILTDAEIVFAMLQERIVITPLICTSQIQSAIDLRLGTEFVVKNMDSLTHLDPVHFHRLQERNPEGVSRYYDTIRRSNPAKAFVLHSGQFALGSTLEYIKLPPEIGGMLEGRSSWAREGLNVHSTAGLIHPGHTGVIVFELHNAGTHPIPLYPGIRVAQLLLYELKESCQQPYAPFHGAKYSNYLSTNFGRPWEDWEFSYISKATMEHRIEIMGGGGSRERG